MHLMPLRVRGRPPRQLVDSHTDLGEITAKCLLKGRKTKAQPLRVRTALLPDRLENRAAKLHERFHVATNHRESPGNAGQLDALHHFVPLVLDRCVDKLGNLVELLLQMFRQLDLTCDNRGELGWFQGTLLDETPQVKLELEGLDIDFRGDRT